MATTAEPKVGDYRICKDGIGRYIVQMYTWSYSREWKDISTPGFWSWNPGTKRFRSLKSAQRHVEVLQYEKKRLDLVNDRDQVWP